MKTQRAWGFSAFLVAFFGLATLLPIQGARAASMYDPGLTFRTVCSSHFSVHYFDGAYNLAVRVARLGEELLRANEALLTNVPHGRIEVVLIDSMDDANGSAQILPRNILRLYLAAPNGTGGLSNYDNWLKTLLAHELAHIVDMDHVGGFTQFLRHFFGRVVSYNGSVPQVLSEGVAVYAETVLTGQGRGRASQVEAILRMAALGHTFVSFDQANILFAHYPFGNAAYAYGGRFHLYLEQRFGRSAIARLHHYYASQLVPLVFGPGAYEVLGFTLPTLWHDFEQYELRYALEVEANLKAQGPLTVAKQLTTCGGELGGARFTANGHTLVYGRRSSVDGPTLRSFDFVDGNDRRLALDSLSTQVAPTPQGHGVWYMAPALTHRFDRWGDLVYLDFFSGHKTTLFDVTAPGKSLRATEPALSPDGRRLLFVQTRLHQSWLTEATLALDSHGKPKGPAVLRRLAGPHGDMQYGSPSFSPDGQLVAARIDFGDGLHDVAILDAGSGEMVLRLTHDTAQDTGPVWTPDGRYVIYASDAEGISNLYAYELAQKARWRLTRVIGGASEPAVSPDGKTLVFRGTVAHGFELFSMDLNPATWERVDYWPENGGSYPPAVLAAKSALPSEVPSWQTAPLPQAVSRAAEPHLALHADETEGPYRLHTLIPGRDNWFIIPGLYVLNNDLGLVLYTLNQDALMRHTWTVALSATVQARRPNISISYIYDRWRPTFELHLNRVAAPYIVANGLVVESDTSVAVRAVVPLRNRHTFALEYSFQHRGGDQRAHEYLPLGRFAALNLGYNYSFTRFFPYSISPEHGRSLGLSATWFSRALGGHFDELLLGVDARTYINNPWFNNHVLALRVVANQALGPDRVQSYFLYGSQAASVLTAQTDRLFALRGFLPNRHPFAAPTPGTGLVAGYAEYRLPLWHIQHGIGSWPVFFRHLHLAGFVDAGNTFGRLEAQDSPSQPSATDIGWALSHLWASFGAEIRLDMAFAWAYGLTWRVGVAEPLLVRGGRVVDRATPVVYLNMGTTL